jgi:quercetin dioxygenase-like cupin family protein
LCSAELNKDGAFWGIVVRERRCVQMTDRFVVRRGATADYHEPGDIAPGSTGLTRWRGVGYDDGAVHSDLGVCRLEVDGVVPAHVHSFEESFHLLEGEVVLATPEATVRLVAGDYGVIPVGVPHSWRAVAAADEAAATAVWADMFAPPAREQYGSDTYRVPELPVAEPTRVDPRDPRTRSFGAISTQQMDPAQQSQEQLAQSASMRTALLVYSGISLKMMVDSDLGATLSTMFMVQYEPDGRAGPHDHPLEETYLILDGEVDATFDGQAFRLVPGDIAWAGAGCVHSFSAVGAPVRWLETQSPQMPARHAYRFARDWDYLSTRLEEEQP